MVERDEAVRIAYGAVNGRWLGRVRDDVLDDLRQEAAVAAIEALGRLEDGRTPGECRCYVYRAALNGARKVWPGPVRKRLETDLAGGKAPKAGWLFSADPDATPQGIMEAREELRLFAEAAGRAIANASTRQREYLKAVVFDDPLPDDWQRMGKGTQGTHAKRAMDRLVAAGGEVGSSWAVSARGRLQRG